MSYATGTISGDANVGVTLRALLHDMLVAHPAWEFIEEASGVAVYRCRGTHNLWGQDFHIGLQASGATVTYSAFEEWNTTAKKCRRPVPNQATSHVVAGDASMGGGTEYTVQTDTTQVWNKVVTYSTTTTAYMLSVTNDFVLTAVSTALPRMFLGVFESLIPGYQFEFPLVMADLGASNTSSTTQDHAWSRYPRKENAGTSAVNFKGSAFGRSSPVPFWTSYSGIVAGTADPIINLPVATRIGVFGYGTTATYIGMRGILPTSVLFAEAAASVVFVDTLTINGQVYAAIGRGASGTPHVWINTEAA